MSKAPLRRFSLVVCLGCPSAGKFPMRDPRNGELGFPFLEPHIGHLRVRVAAYHKLFSFGAETRLRRFSPNGFVAAAIAGLGTRAIGRWRSIERGDEGGDARRDLGAEARAVEDAVVADLRLQVMRLAAGGDAGGDPVRRLGLADAGNVVVLALAGEHGDAADRAGIDGLVAVAHLALGESVAKEYRLD